MAEFRSGVTGLVLAVVVFALLGAALVATALLWWLGDWEGHGWALWLTLRIVWGVWLATCLGMVLTRATMFGWYFRRYFGRSEPGAAPPKESEAPTAERPPPPPPPWPKSGAASFSITIVLTSLTGAAIVATVVLWALRDVLGATVYGWVVGIIWAAWWVLVIATVLTRVAIFGTQKKKAVRAPPAADGSASSDRPDLSSVTGPGEPS
jgi:hypothetical protein